MSMSSDPRQELSHTYVIQDLSNDDELTRLRIQDTMTTLSMGGTLPDQSDTSIFEKVLDVGCGPGGWLVEAAKTYPHLSLLVGVDASRKMVEYARMQAKQAGVSDRVEYHVMDALRMLEFPDDYFDLVNQRLAASWLRTWDWPHLLTEYQRVCRPGAIIRVTEADFIKESSSPALTRLVQLTVQALYNAGHYFVPQGDGVISRITGVLQRSGIQHVQARVCLMPYQAHTPEWQGFFADSKHLFRNIQPFLSKWIRIPEDYEQVYQQMLLELQEPDFVGYVESITAWGQVNK